MSRRKTLTLKELIGYGLTELPGTLNTILGAFLTMFYTDSIGMAAAAVGTMFFISRLFDGISDLIAGSIVDNTRTKWGKARPWLLWLSIPTGLAIAAIFWVPTKGSAVAQLAYAFITYNLFVTILYTMISVAKVALMPLMTQDGMERSIRGTMTVLIGLGGALLGCSITFPFIMSVGGNVMAWRIVFAVYGFIVAAGTLLAFFLLREHVTAAEPSAETAGKAATQKMPFKEGLSLFFRNRYFILSLAIYFLVQFSNQLNSSSQTYFYKYAMNNTMLTASMNLFNLVPMIASLMLLATPMIQKFGKKKTVLIGAALHVAGYILRGFAASVGSVPMLAIGTIVCAVGTGPMAVPVQTLAADAVDYGEWKHGKRIEGMGSAVNTAGAKLATGLAGGCVGWILALTGYVAEQAQTAAANTGIISLFAWIPGILVVGIIIIVTVFYHYDDEVDQVLADLDARKAKNN